jgi:GNAT superfamily N-acetyltransferase
MLIEVPLERREQIRPLMGGFGLRLHGLVEAVCSPDFGRAWVDDVEAPSVVAARCDFWFLAGDAASPAAPDAVRTISNGTIVTPAVGSWDAVVRATLGARVTQRTRTGFATPPPDAWDRERLQSFVAAVPPEFEIRRVTSEGLASYEAIEKALVGNFRTNERFLDRGFGFGAWHNGRYVAGCSTFTLASGKAEIEIDTVPEFRRRGLARAVAAAMILHCLEHGIEPCWDAHNEMSSALALQLGFTDPTPYTVFVVPR